MAPALTLRVLAMSLARENSSYEFSPIRVDLGKLAAR
jgi:hypothetical protein